MEPYDVAEATRLVCDVSSILAETERGGDADHVPTLHWREAAALLEDERLAQAVDAKETFYREVAELWKVMKTAFDQRDMALVRGAHEGLRALALRELEGAD